MSFLIFLLFSAQRHSFLLNLPLKHGYIMQVCPPEKKCQPSCEVSDPIANDTDCRDAEQDNFCFQMGCVCLPGLFTYTGFSSLLEDRWSRQASRKSAIKQATENILLKVKKTLLKTMFRSLVYYLVPVHKFVFDWQSSTKRFLCVAVSFIPLHFYLARDGSSTVKLMQLFFRFYS